MSDWEILGLEPDADERSIKRAYARLLKTHRPDEDIAAFQRLREAYESALEQTRWRAQYEEDEHDSPLVLGDIPPEPFQVPVQGVQLTRTEPEPDYQACITDVPEPEISMNLIRQWLDEGQEQRVFDALSGLLNSEALLSFDRRQAFEEQLLQCLEESEHWSPELFERIARLMRWEDDRGYLPCANWRWQQLLDRCTATAELAGMRRDLDSPRPERALSFVCKPLTDVQRRRLADHLFTHEWQDCHDIAARVERHSEVSRQRLGLEVQPGWRDWLPSKVIPLLLYLWLLFLPALAMHLTPDKQGWTVVHVFFVATMGVIGAGAAAWANVLWRYTAIWLVAPDIALSQALLPARLYRRGAGLLVLRHVFPAVALVLVGSWLLRASPWWQWSYPLLALPVLLSLVDATLRGTIPAPWERLYHGLTKPTQETGW
ncbi:MAG: J domain-containing protein [Pseudomonas sp.]|uniref:J domain-containing protein n=1 Tax=Pseudomonas sp. TaxID=306 RepID=UPI003D150DA0